MNENNTENRYTIKNVIVLFSLLLISILSVIYIGFSRNIPQTDVSSDSSSTEKSIVSSDVSQNENEEVSEESKIEIKKFPYGVKIHETDVSNMTAQQAKDELDKWAKDYSLSLTVNSYTQVYEASVFGVKFADIDIEKMLDEAKSGQAFTVENPIVFDENLLSKAVYSFPGSYVPPVDASISYSSSKDAFILSKEQDGSRLDLSLVCEAVKNAVKTRASSLTQTADKTAIKPNTYSTHPNAEAALKKANDLLNISLSYTYSPSGKPTSTEKLSKAQIADFIITDDNFSVEISDYRLNNYCSQMSNKYSVSGGYSSFTATGGYTVNISVPSGGHYVDKDALFNDIKNKISNNISGTFTAPYYSSGSTNLNFDGTYIEINLSAQHMWFYKNGTCIISTDIVSGNVATWHHTPTGLFSVTSKAKNISLIGRDYIQPVDYWIGFSDPYYGIHDSLWRTSGYGGTIYLYDGSHGCVNTPYDAVAFIYENVDYFTPVIVFGGEATANVVTQELEGTKEYSKVLGDASFTLDAKPKYNTSLEYSCNNPEILEVSKDGVVTIKKNGTAVITVTAIERQGFTSATMQITVNVKTKCEISGSHLWDSGNTAIAPTCKAEGKKEFICTVCGEKKTEVIAALTTHSFGEGVVTTPATCKDGIKTYTCSVCGNTKTEPIAATAPHSWDSGTVTTPPTCENGINTFTCLVCGETKTEDIAATDPHSWDSGTVTTPPSCEDSGEITFACIVCGDTKSEPQSATGHSYLNSVCSICGKNE